MTAQAKNRRPRRIAPTLFLLAFAARLFYDGIATPYPRSWNSDGGDDESGGEGGGLRRHLAGALDEGDLMRDLDSESVRNAALGSGDEELPRHRNLDGNDVELTPYTLLDAVREADVWESAFAVLVYDPEIDKFVGLYSARHRRTSSCRKLWGSVNNLANMLRRVFPERFRRGHPDEFAVAIGSGDYPHVKPQKLPHEGGVAPVLQFGSAFRERGLYPNMVAMPMPGTHLGCFEEWARLGRVCEAFRPGGGFRSKWDELIPQLIWRGTDFGYLPTLRRPKLSQPLNNHIESIVAQRTSEQTGERNKKMAAARALRENYDQLLPRWKGAVLTAEAEVELDVQKPGNRRKLPWANIKFSRYLANGATPPTVGSDKYRTYDEVGIATGDFLSRPELAKYRYHVDLGGGGGTTWTGTIEKLALPGLLFHHVTPARDYIHDRLEPWVHYVPVSPDLRDLREKFEWAEGHPEDAERIAGRATRLMRHLGTPGGFGEMFREDFVEPLRRTVEAYRPVSSGRLGMTWRDVLRSLEGGDGAMLPAVECSGMTNNPASCRSIDGDVVAERRRMGHAGGVPVRGAN